LNLFSKLNLRLHLLAAFGLVEALLGDAGVFANRRLAATPNDPIAADIDVLGTRITGCVGVVGNYTEQRFARPAALCARQPWAESGSRGGRIGSDGRPAGGAISCTHTGR
jgi:hypothetical protein